MSDERGIVSVVVVRGDRRVAVAPESVSIYHGNGILQASEPPSVPDFAFCFSC